MKHIRLNPPVQVKHSAILFEIISTYKLLLTGSIFNYKIPFTSVNSERGKNVRGRVDAPSRFCLSLEEICFFKDVACIVAFPGS